ncbi:MAG: transporter substrate-binding protein [Thermoleophilia bacterium]|nr:transporter substrate-binding protein [Thermoleophilia bacterium]
MRRSTTLLRATAMVVASAAIAAGCGGGSSGGSSSGGGGGSAPDTKRVPAGDTKPTGDISVCMGKDTSGIHGPLLKKFNAANPGANATLVELPESADEQRTQLVQRLRAKSKECDVLALDVVWTAEFAAQGWLADASDIVDKRKDEFIPSTLDTARYDDKYFAVPFNSNAGFIYYRTDQAPDGVPKTWQDLYAKAATTKGLTYQGSRYEGLTVHFLELLYSAGGDVLDKDGTKSTADSDTTRKVLQFMVDGVKDGAVPKATLTYKEEEARRAFESGAVTFMRNWPYAYSLGQSAPAIKGKFEVAPFPSFGDAEAASVLGGYNLAVSQYSDNAAGAAAVINYLTAMDAQVTYAEGATPPVLEAAYDEASVKKALPFASTLHDSIAQGRSRPVSPVYPQISEAISTNVYAALAGEKSVDAAVKAMDGDITKALGTF